MRKKNLVLLLLTFPGIVLAQTTTPSRWQEYSFKRDSFAITAPASPRISDPPAPDVRIYRWDLPANVVFVIHIGVVSGCRDDVARIKNLTKSRSNGGSIKDISQGGFSGVEQESTLPTGRKVLERLYCADKKAYDLSAGYPSSGARPPEIDRMFRSFRFLNSSAK